MISLYLPYLMSAITIYQLSLAGKQRASTWLWGLGNQTLWLTWIVATESWGLLPMTAALVVLYARNFRLWTQAAAQNVGKTDSWTGTPATASARSARIDGP